MTLTAGFLSGAIAGLVWTLANLLYDAVFNQVVRRHQDQLNPKLLARPARLQALVGLSAYGLTLGWLAA
jgi:cell division protein FtsX